MSRSALHSGQIIFRGSKSGPTKSRTPRTPSVLSETLGYCSHRIQLRNTGRLSRDECARENQLCARRARIRETAPCTKKSLIDDGAKDSITNRRVRSRIIRALELHGHHLAPGTRRGDADYPPECRYSFPDAQSRILSIMTRGLLGSSLCAIRLQPFWLKCGRQRRGQMRLSVRGTTSRLENPMSNESQSGNMKSEQQSQGTAPQTGKDATQQGGSDRKSGQQSQGVSQKDGDGMKQAGSANIANDPKKAAELGQKSGSSK